MRCVRCFSRCNERQCTPGTHNLWKNESRGEHSSLFRRACSARCTASQSRQQIKSLLRLERFKCRITLSNYRRDATTSSPRSSLTSILPSLELLAHGSGSSSEEEEDDGDDEQAPQTFSSIEESLEQDYYVSLCNYT